MSSTLDRHSPADVGERLRNAREAARITQAAAAAAACMARTTLIAVEHGQRKIRMDELLCLAKQYGTSVNALFRRQAVHADLTSKFSNLTLTDASVVGDARLLTDLANAEAELEDLLGIHRIRNYPRWTPILPGDARAQAEADAFEVRQWLGLGSAPIGDMAALLESLVGMRVFVRELEPRISGLYAFDEAVGGCLLLNAAHSRDRRDITAAHGLARLVSTRDQPEVLLDEVPDQARDERYTASFAGAFLMPARAVTRNFQQITMGSSHLSRRHVILMARGFFVSPETLLRRLGELKLVRPGTRDWFEAHGGITESHARHVLGDASFEATYGTSGQESNAIRLNLLAAEAWRRELLSEGQLARLLRLDRVALRTILDECSADAIEADAVLELNG